jgi:hypothetical protein
MVAFKGSDESCRNIFLETRIVHSITDNRQIVDGKTDLFFLCPNHGAQRKNYNEEKEYYMN